MSAPLSILDMPLTADWLQVWCFGTLSDTVVKSVFQILLSTLLTGVIKNIILLGNKKLSGVQGALDFFSLLTTRRHNNSLQPFS